MSVLGVIPARGGSKSIPEKNVIELHGKPLLAWSIEQAFESSVIDCVFVSTDSNKIGEVARRYGARCDFYRPKNLAGDAIGTGLAIEHSLKELSNRGCFFDIVVELQPTYCFRPASTIRDVVMTLKNNIDIDSIITCSKVIDTSHPDFVMSSTKSGMLKFGSKKPDQFARQRLPPFYSAKGIVLASRVQSYLRQKTFFVENSLPHIIDNPIHSFDINHPMDLEIAKAICLKKLNALP